jgi:hypothetical protein
MHAACNGAPADEERLAVLHSAATAAADAAFAAHAKPSEPHFVPFHEVTPSGGCIPVTRRFSARTVSHGSPFLCLSRKAARGSRPRR